MGTAPFVASVKLPNGTHAKLPQPAVTKVPKQWMSAVERLRRLEEAIAFLRTHPGGRLETCQNAPQRCQIGGHCNADPPSGQRCARGDGRTHGLARTVGV